MRDLSKKLGKVPGQRQQHSQMLWSPWMRHGATSQPGLGQRCCMSWSQSSVFCAATWTLVPCSASWKCGEQGIFPSATELQHCLCWEGLGRFGAQGQNWSQITLLRAFPVTSRKPPVFHSPNSPLSPYEIPLPRLNKIWSFCTSLWDHSAHLGARLLNSVQFIGISLVLGTQTWTLRPRQDLMVPGKWE